MAPEVTLQRPGALQKRCVPPEAAVVASGSVEGALSGPRSDVAPSGSVAGALRGLRSGSCSVREQQLQRPGPLQEHCSGQETAVTAFGSVTGALHRPGSSSCSVRERCNGQSSSGKVDRSSLRSLGAIQQHYYRYSFGCWQPKVYHELLLNSLLVTVTGQLTRCGGAYWLPARLPG